MGTCRHLSAPSRRQASVLYISHLPATFPPGCFSSTMLTVFTADQVPLAITAQGQSTGSGGVPAPLPDSIADLWPKLDRMMLTSCRRTAPSSLHLPVFQYVDLQGAPDATSFSGNSLGHSGQELPDMDRHQYTTELPVGISTAIEDVICDHGSCRQCDPPAQQMCICKRSSDGIRKVSASAFRTRSGQTPLSSLTKHHRERLSRLLRDLHLDDDIDTLSYGNAREYPGKQNPVLKHIRLRRASKRHSSRARRTING